jgi:hypothetical protein
VRRRESGPNFQIQPISKVSQQCLNFQDLISKAIYSTVSDIVWCWASRLLDMPTATADAATETGLAERLVETAKAFQLGYMYRPELLCEHQRAARGSLGIEKPTRYHAVVEPSLDPETCISCSTAAASYSPPPSPYCRRRRRRAPRALPSASPHPAPLQAGHPRGGNLHLGCPGQTRRIIRPRQFLLLPPPRPPALPRRRPYLHQPPPRAALCLTLDPPSNASTYRTHRSPAVVPALILQAGVDVIPG